MKNNFIYSSKQEWNEIIDKRILKKLKLKEGDEVTIIKLSRLARQKLTSKDIAEIWKERPNDETKKRINYLMVGLRKYSKSYPVAFSKDNRLLK